MRKALQQHYVTISFIFILIAIVFFYDRDAAKLHQLSGYTMGTSYQFQIADMPDELDPQSLAEKISQLLKELDSETFSTFAENSELSRFNRYSIDTAFPASEKMLEVLSLAQKISAISDGAFDITVGPLVNIWGFGPVITAADAAPDDSAIAQARSRVGYQFLSIDKAKSEVQKSRDIYLDLSAIAKGYAVDQVANVFDEVGIENYFLEIGGELKIKGLKPGNKSWVPAIETPLDTESEVYEIFFNRGETIAVAGSGDYRNYFEEEGTRYSHEIDPRSGRPVSHKLAAAYVIDESTARADALATAFMVLGLEQSIELAEKLNQAVYLIYKNDISDEVDAGFSDFVSDEFASYLQAP